MLLADEEAIDSKYLFLYPSFLEILWNHLVYLWVWSNDWKRSCFRDRCLVVGWEVHQEVGRTTLLRYASFIPAI